MGGWALPCLGHFSHKGFLPPNIPGTSKDCGGTESEGGPRVDSGWPQDEVYLQLGSYGMAQCFCNQAPSFAGLNVTCDVEGGASAALMGALAPLRAA